MAIMSVVFTLREFLNAMVPTVVINECPLGLLCNVRQSVSPLARSHQLLQVIPTLGEV